MARAILKPVGEQGGRGNKRAGFPESLSRQESNTLSQARFILRHDEQLAQSAATANSALASPNPTPCRFSNPTVC